MKQIEFKITHPEQAAKCGIKAPKYMTPGAACVDLHACISKPVTVFQNRVCEMIGSGIAINLKDTGYVALVYARSGLALKEGLSLANGVGVIDSDYQGQIILGMTSKTQGIQVKPGERIAQLMIVPIARPTWKQVEEFTAPTTRGAKGVGSTGKAADGK